MRYLLSLALVAMIVAPVAAAPILESATNDTQEDATLLLQASDGAAAVGLGSLFPQDVDWWVIRNVPAGWYVSATAVPVAGSPLIPPAMWLALIGPAGVSPVTAFDPGQQPDQALTAFIQAPIAGDYYIAITGLGDGNMEGGHDQSGLYAVVAATFIPEPATLALVGFGGLALLARRRRARA